MYTRDYIPLDTSQKNSNISNKNQLTQLVTSVLVPGIRTPPQKKNTYINVLFH